MVSLRNPRYSKVSCVQKSLGYGRIRCRCWTASQVAETSRSTAIIAHMCPHNSATLPILAKHCHSQLSSSKSSTASLLDTLMTWIPCVQSEFQGCWSSESSAWPNYSQYQSGTKQTVEPKKKCRAMLYSDHNLSVIEYNNSQK